MHPEVSKPWTLRRAREEDIPALEELIPLSVRSLQTPYYSAAQIEGAIGAVFGVDRQIIRDGTYFVAEHAGMVVGCGGWSKRKALFGGNYGRAEGQDSMLDPEREPARIRAFFVHPMWARRGIGRGILVASEREISAARFRGIELVATLAGEPLYAACGYIATGRYDVALPNGSALSVVRMTKQCVLATYVKST